MHLPSKLTTLRVRLFLSYAALVLLTVVLATGTPLVLFARRMIEDARSDMTNQAVALANVVAAVNDDDTPIEANRLARILYADPRIRDRPRQLLVVDAAGRPAIAIYPPPRPPFRPGGGRGPEDALRDGGPEGEERADARDRLPSWRQGPPGDGSATETPPRVAGAARSTQSARPDGQLPEPRQGPRQGGPPLLRRPRQQFHDVRFAPQPVSESGSPVIGEVGLTNGMRLLYVTVPLSVTLNTAAADLSWLDKPLDPPLYLVVYRPRAEVRGMWRPLLPSIALAGSLALALASVIAYLLARSITHPLEAMTRASERIAAGDYTVRVSHRGRDEVGRLAAAFNAMAGRVGEAQQRQRDFVTNVSHDLRTPLTSIRGFARALLDGTARTDAQRRKAVEAIEGAGGRMAMLVETLIDLARLEGQEGGMQAETVAASALLSRVANDHRHAADVADVRVVVDAPEGLTVRVDPVWMARALGNLVDNAIQHSPHGAEVRLGAAADDDGEVELVVADHGLGIPAEDLRRVFERFYRGDRARSTNGSGLGLAIAREIVEGHGGTIDIESTLGRGTRVVVRLAGG